MSVCLIVTQVVNALTVRGTSAWAHTILGCSAVARPVRPIGPAAPHNIVLDSSGTDSSPACSRLARQHTPADTSTDHNRTGIVDLERV